MHRPGSRVRLAVALCALPPALAACSGALTGRVGGPPRTVEARQGILTCAAEVATLAGLPTVERSDTAQALRAASLPDRSEGVPSAAADSVGALDEVTVSLSPRAPGVPAALRVAARTFRLAVLPREGRGDASATRGAAGREWRAAAPSARAIAARDLVLARCGSLGHVARR
jgi:hypothetical protein